MLVAGRTETASAGDLEEATTLHSVGGGSSTFGLYCFFPSAALPADSCSAGRWELEASGEALLKIREENNGEQRRRALLVHERHLVADQSSLLG